MDDDVEQKVTTWFRHLPAEHPVTRALFKIAVERMRAAQKPAPTPARPPGTPPPRARP